MIGRLLESKPIFGFIIACRNPNWQMGNGAIEPENLAQGDRSRYATKVRQSIKITINNDGKAPAKEIVERRKSLKVKN
jgi:hypothetical protein